jgi:hypothetical protein
MMIILLKQSAEFLSKDLSDEQAENRMTDVFKSMKIRLNDECYKMATGHLVNSLKNTKVLPPDL